jgi:hypothetical protein
MPNLRHSIVKKLNRHSQFAGSEFVPSGPNFSVDSICQAWKEEFSRVQENPKTAELLALNFLKQSESTLSCALTGVIDPVCRWMATLKASLGGSFESKDTAPVIVSETVSYSGLPHEKRVTATIILNPTVKESVSLSSVFEDFLIQQSREKTAPRVFNSIRVNKRKEELAISAGGGLDDIYAFSHCNDATNSIWIILYMGPSKTVEYGRKLIEKFQVYLLSCDFTIRDSVVLTSEEEESMEREAEERSESDRARDLESRAQLGLRLLCTN